MNRAIAWMARNGVAANLLLVFIVVAGMLAVFTVPQEVFPEFALDTIQITVEYPGASPEEIEEAIVQRIEERIDGVEGVRRVTAVASEGVGVVLAELNLGTDEARALDDVKAEIDRIVTFPEDAEEPEVVALTARSRVIEIALYGDVDERTLRELAYRAKDDLASIPDISYVQVAGVREYEISIEVSMDALRAWGLTLDEVAAVVRRASLDLPGGDVRTDSEEILVRVEGQNYTRADFAEIIVRGSRDGAALRLDQIAEIRDGFEDVDLISRFEGQPAAFVQVFRTGDERVLESVELVQDYLAGEFASVLPKGVEYAIWENEADYLDSRISLLLKNARIGLVLVLLALTLFLNLRLAFWTAVGIFLSFVGTFAVMHTLGATINMLSLFGFILAIGIVVDDAIVVGESIYHHRERGVGRLDASIRGTRRVAVPVTFAVLTTVAAFTPLLFVPGSIGKFMGEIPTVVIAVLLLSLVEALLILPYHLSHLPRPEEERRDGFVGRIRRAQDVVHAALQRFINGPLDRAVRFATRRYGLVLAGATAIVLIVAGLVGGRYIRFSFLPDIEGEEVLAYLEMPEGTPAERTREIAAYIERVGRDVAADLQAELPIDHPPFVEAVFTSVGERPSQSRQPSLAATPSFIQSNIAELSFRLLDSEERQLPASTFEQAWRERVGVVPGARTLTFNSVLIDLGAPVQVELSHPDTASLNRAVEALESELERFAGVLDVRDDRGRGKRELQLELKPAGRTLGVTLDDLARQVRAGFFGAEALRLQRGRDEVRVYVRLPADERNTLADLRDYRIRAPSGGAVPLSEVAEVSFDVGASTVRRIDGRRIVTITADVNRAVVTGQEVNGALEGEVLPQLRASFPGLRFSFGGEQREQAEAIGGMARGFALALVVIYAMLAIPFRSYVQPLIIMASIPLGFVGAALGHLMMGLDLQILSLFGIVGLSGVVVNDSLVFIDFINEERRSGKEMAQAIVDAAKIRFRPIFLTSLTTFLGVSPIIFERSIQAQFLVPMAVSLGFGILIATAIIMLVVPALSMLQHRAAERVASWRDRPRSREVDIGWAGEG
jgi:multidrug efflux pump subunit AcrB